MIQWHFDCSPLLTGYRSVCFSSVLGSEEGSSVTSVEVVVL